MTMHRFDTIKLAELKFIIFVSLTLIFLNALDYPLQRVKLTPFFEKVYSLPLSLYKIVFAILRKLS